MRFLYSNIVDGLAASQMTALTTLTGYSVLNVQDQRLGLQWKSGTATSQTLLFTFPIMEEWPDNATGTTYLQGAWATTDSWTASTGATAIVTAGTLLFSSNASGQSLSRALVVPSNASVIMKVCVANLSDQNISGLHVNGTVADVPVSIDGTWTIAELAMMTSVTLLTTYLNGTTAATAYGLYVDWVYVGDGTRNTTVTDQSGNGRDGTVVKGVVPVQGPNGKSRGLRLDGVAGRVQKTSASLPTTATEVSISAWVQLGSNANTTLHSAIFSANKILLGIIPTQLNFWTDDTAGFIVQKSYSFGTALHHIVATCDGATCQFYVDGALINNVACNPLNMAASGVPIASGTHNSTARPLAGTVSELRVWSRVLSAREVGELYAQRNFATRSIGLELDWTLDADYSVGAAALLGHNLLPGTRVKVSADSSGEFNGLGDYPSQYITVDDPAALLVFTTPSVYKYWRFKFYDQGSIELGRAWLGPVMQLSTASLDNFKVIRRRSDLVVYGKDRNKFASPGVGWRRIELSFPPEAYSAIKQIEDMHDAVGNHSSLIFCNFDSLADYQLVEPLYCSIVGDVGFTHAGRQRYTFNLTLEEDR